MPSIIRIPIHLGDHDQIMCRHTVTASRPQGYPVVEIDGPEPDAPLVAITFTRGRLERLRDCIGAYLAAHPISPVGCDPADRVDILHGPVGPARPAVAEAVLDHDDLFASAMAAGFGPRGVD